jgi:hypothetical protein
VIRQRLIPFVFLQSIIQSKCVVLMTWIPVTSRPHRARRIRFVPSSACVRVGEDAGWLTV